jgi:hypothetical protein
MMFITLKDVIDRQSNQKYMDEVHHVTNVNLSTLKPQTYLPSTLLACSVDWQCQARRCAAVKLLTARSLLFDLGEGKALNDFQ